MLNLERESESDGGCLYRLGHPGPYVGALCRGEDSNLHCHRRLQAEPQFQLALGARAGPQSGLCPVRTPALARGGDSEATFLRPQPNR